MMHPILAAQALGLDTTTPGWKAHAERIAREGPGPWTDGALFCAPEGELIERAARTRAVERYPLYIPAGDAIESNDGASDGCPPAAIRHVLAGCLVYELAVGGGFRYGTPPPAEAADLARLPEALRRADLDPDYPDAPHYAVAVRVMEAWLGMSSTRDPEGPVGGVGSDPEQVSEGVDLAIRLLASPEPVAEIVADAAATVLHGGRAKAAARARRMLRVVALPPRSEVRQ